MVKAFLALQLFLLPLFFLPFTFEFFALAKLALLFIFLSFNLGYLLRRGVSRPWAFAFCPKWTDVPVLFFLLALIFSTLSSLNPQTSFLGNYSRFFGSLVSFILLGLWYFAFSRLASLAPKGFLEKTILFSVSGVGFYVLLQFLGLDFLKLLGQVDTAALSPLERLYSTLGSPLSVAGLLVVAYPLLLDHYPKNNLLVFLFPLVIFLIGFLPALVLLIPPLLLSFARHRRLILLLVMGGILAGTAFLLSKQPLPLTAAVLPGVLAENETLSLFEALPKDKWVFGQGPETLALLRWGSDRFFAESIGRLYFSGGLGVLSFWWLILFPLLTLNVVKKPEKAKIVTTVLSLFVLSFFTFFDFTLYFLLFALLALAGHQQTKRSAAFSPSPLFLPLPLFGTLLAISLLLADIFYTHGLRQNRDGFLAEAEESFSRATTLFPFWDAYFRDRSQALLGQVFSTRPLPTPKEARARLKEAEAYALSAVSLVPLRAENLLNLARVQTESAFFLNDQALILSGLKIFTEAAELEGQNPTIPTAHAQVLARLSLFQEAEEKIKKALELKPDFDEALFTLAAVKQAQGQKEEALRLLRRIPEKSRFFLQIQRLIEELEKI